MGLPVGKGQSVRLSDGEDCRAFNDLEVNSLISEVSDQFFSVHLRMEKAGSIRPGSGCLIFS